MGDAADHGRELERTEPRSHRPGELDLEGPGKSYGPNDPTHAIPHTNPRDADTITAGELGRDPRTRTRLDVEPVATGDVEAQDPTLDASSPAELAARIHADPRPADAAAGDDRGDEIDDASTARETPDATLPTTPEPRAEVAKPPSIKGAEAPGLPGVLVGHETAAVGQKVEGFYRSVATMFEAWIARRKSENTRRAYRRDVMDFVEFLGIQWPSVDAQGRIVGEDESWRLLQATVPSVQAWRDYLLDERNLAPNTLNRRVSSLSGFYRFLRESAAEMRLPITVPNPAHSQFISREVQEPVTPTEALSPTRARQLIALPDGEGVIASRDRAVLKFYLYSGCRIGTGCRLNVEDFIDDDEDPKIRIQEKGKGKSKRALGINAIAADALREYIDRAGLVSGPLFRPRSSSKGEELAARRMEVSTMYRLVQSYLVRLPKAMREHELEDGRVETRCIYSPHSIRATTATVLLDAGEDIRDVQKLLGHKHVTVTQVYDKRRRGTKDRLV